MTTARAMSTLSNNLSGIASPTVDSLMTTMPAYLNSEDYVSQEVKTALFVILVAVAIIGVIGNSMTIASVATSHKLQTVPNVYVANLAITDLVICALSAPFSIYALVSADSLRANDGGSAFCQFMGVLTLLSLIMTIVNLTLISLNRYVLLVRGSKLYMRLFSRRNVVLSLGFVYTIAIAGALPPLLGFGHIGYNPKMGICIFKAYDSLTYWYVQSVLHILIAGPCFFVTVFCYMRILMHFRAAQRRVVTSHAYGSSALSPAHPRMSSSSTATSTPRATYVVGRGNNGSATISAEDHDSSHIEDYELSSSAAANGSSTKQDVSCSSANHKRSRASRRVTFNLLTVFVIFLVCWLPIILIFTIDYPNTIPAVVSHFGITLALTNSCLNVFIYAGMNRGFRKSYWYILSCQWAKLRADLV